MKKRQLQNLFKVNALYDWESEEFLSKSLKIITDATKFDLYHEQPSEIRRSFQTELEEAILLWKSSQDNVTM